MSEPVRADAWHLPAQVLERYADPRAALPPAQAASAEAHLDSCPTCRTRLRPPADELLATVGEALRGQLPATPQYRRARRRQVRLTAGLPLAWLSAAVAVCLLAGLLDVVADAWGGSRPPLLLLLAPALPLLGVAAAWTPALDPLQELTASTPGAGLGLLLRRTLVVLLAVVPLATVLGVLGHGPALQGWLLPCLALTATALAAGSVVPLHQAAGALGALWAFAVVVPGLTVPHVPVLLQPDATPAWLGVLATAALTAAVRRRAYRSATTP